MDALKQHGLEENTLVFYASDNGAPLNFMTDSSLGSDPGGWDGSLNTPFLGEKGMLAEGGIRVPYLARFPGRWKKISVSSSIPRSCSV